VTVLLYAVCWQIAHLSLLTVVTSLDSGESKHDLIDLVHQAEPSIQFKRGQKTNNSICKCALNVLLTIVHLELFLKMLFVPIKKKKKIYFYCKSKLNFV